MKKTFAALVAVATIAGSLAATPASAQRGVAAGVAAGLLGGAIIGGAIASSRPAYGGPVYVEEAPYPACRMVRERFWEAIAPPTMAPPINPAATPAATPRCAWAGAGIATAETASTAAAPSAIKVFFMALPFS